VLVHLTWSGRQQPDARWGCGEFYRDYPVNAKGLQQAAASLREQLPQAMKGRPALPRPPLSCKGVAMWRRRLLLPTAT
jgi:hypothetical protein